MDAKAAGWELPVRRLLRKLRRPFSLERDELARHLRASYGCATAREALTLAIERALRGHDPRLATIVRRCDVEGDLTHVVAAELHLSPRQFFRYRSDAITAVAVELERSFHLDEPSRDPRRNEARRAFALGMYLMHRFSDDHSRSAAAWLQRAIAADPSFVEAWTALATANVSLALASGPGAGAALGRARSYVRHATGLAPGSPVVGASDANVTLWETRNPKRAREIAHHALDRDDRASRAHFTLGWTGVLEGDFDAAERAFASASAIESHSFCYLAAELTVPFFRTDYATAAARARELLDIEPACGFVLGYLTEALNALGRFGETIEVVEASLRGQRQSDSVLTAYARALALSGRRDCAQAVRRDFTGPAVMRAAIDLALDDGGAALDALESAAGEDNGMLAVVPYDPAFEPLRDEPRYARVVATYSR